MPEATSKIRVKIFILALVSFLSVPTAGLIYYANLHNFAVREAHDKAENRAETATNQIDAYLAGTKKAVKVLAKLETVKQALRTKDDEALTKTNVVLDNFKESLEVSVCYLVDQRGNTIASSNRNQPKSFAGKNYSFRPYFKHAIAGSPDVYMALGVTSDKRGIYFSHPVYDDAQTAPIGVVVIKAPLTFIQEKIDRVYEGYLMLTDPNGIVFASSHKEWLYHSLWKLSPAIIDKIKKSKQFGEGPWPWVGLEKGEGRNAYDEQGTRYMVYRYDVKNIPGWKIVYTHRHEEFSKKVTGPLFELFVYVIVALTLPFGFLAFFLYKMASQDILKRRQAEKELEKSRDELEVRVRNRTVELSDRNEQLREEISEREQTEKEKERLINELQEAFAQIKVLKGIVPICSFCKKIRDDAGYWNKLEKFISEHSEAEFSHSICPDCMEENYPEFADDDS